MRQLLLIGLGALLASPAVAADEMHRSFDAWQAACWSDNYCAATTALSAPLGSTAGFVLTIGRHPQETYWEISVSTLLVRASDTAPFSVAVDGAASQSFAPPDGIAAYGQPSDFYFLGRPAEGLLDRWVRGRELAIGFTDAASARHEVTFPLQGLAGALIWIDTAQHRIGAERVAGAPPAGLARTSGGAPAEAVPVPLPPPQP